MLSKSKLLVLFVVPLLVPAIFYRIFPYTEVVPVKSGDYVELQYSRRGQATTGLIYVYNGTIRGEFMEGYEIKWTQTLNDYTVYPNGSVKKDVRYYTTMKEALPYAVWVHSCGVLSSPSLLLRTDKLEPELAKFIYNDKMQTAFGLRECEVYVYRFEHASIEITIWRDKTILEYNGRTWYLILRYQTKYLGHEESVEINHTNIFERD